jgi:hypothetical protein
MEVEYRKDLHHNYMIITREEAIRTEPYCIRMLEQQRLEGALPLEQRQMNGRHLYYYDITGMQSMHYLLDKSKLSYDKVRRIMRGVLHTLDIAYEFLLPCEDFILKPDFIYLDVMEFTSSLCFLSGYHSEIKEQMNQLLEYLMNKVDYSDKEAVLLVYQLYAASREESFTTMHLYQVLDREFGPPTSFSKQENSAKEVVSMQNSLMERPAAMEENQILEKIPIMLEKVEQEEEKECYPASTYLLSAFCAAIGGLLIILGLTTGILYDTYSENIDYSRLAALLLVILCLEGYLFRKIWDRKNKRSKIITKSEYIDPRTEVDYSVISDYRRKPILAAKLQGESVPQLQKVTEPEQKSRLQTGERSEEQEEDYHPTCLLSEVGKITEALKLCLRPVTDKYYQPILLNEYPFFIGKLKTNVDYCLDQKVISRYHAKITKEEEHYYITDLNSTNGTFINGQMLQTYEKKEIVLGDEISFANISYVFEKQ